MKMSLFDTVRTRTIYFIGQAFSVKVFFMSVVTYCYCLRGIPFDWVYVALMGMLVAFREAKELLAIWRGGTSPGV
jgi:hypothetical protein